LPRRRQRAELMHFALSAPYRDVVLFRSRLMS
jgi:hypothetical protein